MAVALKVPTAAPPFTRPRSGVTSAGLAARVLVALLLAGLVFSLPLFTTEVWDNLVSLAAIYGIIGLSVNVITGYAGQISLGHQAFVGIGAFVSAFLVGRGTGFAVALVGAAITGMAVALALGLVALRIRGLYMALVTLAFGTMAEQTIFNWRSFTGGGAGASAPRPALFASNEAYAYLCLLLLGAAVLVDWRLAKTKAGRAIVAVRNDERVAATIGINTTAYKLFAFGVGGTLAGLAGSLFAHHDKFVYSTNFDLFAAALPWVIMAVVGGLGSRAGIIIASAFFADFSYLFPANKPWEVPVIGPVGAQQLPPLIGALLLLFTLTVYQGGLGQQILPYRRWLAGGRFLEHREEALGIPGQAFLAGFLVPFAIHLPWQYCLAVGLSAGVATGLGLRTYVRNRRPDLHRRRTRAVDEPEAGRATPDAPPDAGGEPVGVAPERPALDHRGIRALRRRGRAG